ncbi:MAG: hypothetical protein IJU87_01930 [Lachnospiraceae bacterium]|nr:hypothetical protein [Lachnospiraceae bacterium]
MGVTDTLMSGLESIGNGALDNLGIIEKAVIEVIDKRLDESKPPLPAVPINGQGGNNGAGGDNAKQNSRFYTVQFNPSTLQLTGYAGGLIQKLDYTSGKKPKRNDGQAPPDQPGEHQHRMPPKSAAYTVGNTTISLNVSLFFDSCDPQDAFMSDKINLSPTGVTTGIVKAGLSIGGKKKVSIQKDVEAFIAALRNRYTRKIIFHWGDFEYKGILRNVTATYVMFNVMGEPVRAHVDLGMICVDKDLSKKSLKVWQDKYREVFGAKEIKWYDATSGELGSRSYVKQNQMFGNLLNI